MSPIRTATLRRSCRACIRAKRRCTVEAPKCARCVSKSLDCLYDNEPLTAWKLDKSPTQGSHLSPISIDSGEHCSRKQLQSEKLTFTVKAVTDPEPMVLPPSCHTLVRLSHLQSPETTTRSEIDLLGLPIPEMHICCDLSPFKAFSPHYVTPVSAHPV